MGVSKNNGIPKSSILIGFSIINHPFWGTCIFGNTHILCVWEYPETAKQKQEPHAILQNLAVESTYESLKMDDWNTQGLHVRNIYLHFPLNVAIFHLM